MTNNRVEAFSDGVLAIVLTIMVLELKVPRGPELSDLRQSVVVFACYVLSFIFVGIYWNNHHHLFQAVSKVNGRVLWANLHLLFWLSLVPFATSWMGENHFQSVPVALYGFILMAAGIAYYILSRSLLIIHDTNSQLVKAIGTDFKGKLSVVVYAAGIVVSPWQPYLSLVLYVSIAVLWLVPDRRIENKIDGVH